MDSPNRVVEAPLESKVTAWRKRYYVSWIAARWISADLDKVTLYRLASLSRGLKPNLCWCPFVSISPDLCYRSVTGNRNHILLANSREGRRRIGGRL